MIAAIDTRKSTAHIGRTPRENMMGKRTSAAKKLNKEAKGNGSSLDQQILATLKEIKKKLDDIEAAISDEARR
jgi:hypothetical protein